MGKIRVVLILAVMFLSQIYADNYFSGFKNGETNGFKTLEGSLDTGVKLFIINSDNLPGEEKIKRVLNIIQSFEIIPLEEIRIIFNKNEAIDMHFSLKPFTWKSNDISNNLSAGFIFKLTDDVVYEADLFSENNHIHINGYFNGEEAFLDKITNIIDNPGTYLLSRDPEYIMNNFIKLEATLENLKTENINLKNEITELKYNNLVMESRGIFGSIKQLNREDIDWVLKAKAEDPSLTSEQTKDKILQAKNIKMSLNIIDLIYGLYYGEYKE